MREMHTWQDQAVVHRDGQVSNPLMSLRSSAPLITANTHGTITSITSYILFLSARGLSSLERIDRSHAWCRRDFAARCAPCPVPT